MLKPVKRLSGLMSVPAQPGVNQSWHQSTVCLFAPPHEPLAGGWITQSL